MSIIVLRHKLQRKLNELIFQQYNFKVPLVKRIRNSLSVLMSKRDDLKT